MRLVLLLGGKLSVFMVPEALPSGCGPSGPRGPIWMTLWTERTKYGPRGSAIWMTLWTERTMVPGDLPSGCGPSGQSMVPGALPSGCGPSGQSMVPGALPTGCSLERDATGTNGCCRDTLVTESDACADVYQHHACLALANILGWLPDRRLSNHICSTSN